MNSLPHKPMAAAEPMPWHQQAFDRLCSRAQSQDLAHAFLLGGEPGIGKRRFAEAFARRLLGDEGDSQRLLAADTHPDLLRIAPEEQGKDIKVDQIRALGDFMARSSHSGRARIAIIEEVDCLNTASANALLKTLEEPGRGCFLLLVSSIPGALLATLRSRCQRLSLPGPEYAEAEHWLRQQLAALPEGPALLSRLEQALADRGRAMLGQPLRLLEDLVSGGGQAQAELRLGQTLVSLWQAGFAAAASVLRPELTALGKGPRLPELAWIGYLQASSTIVIKYGLTRTLPDEADAAQRALCEQFDRWQGEQPSRLRRLARFQQQLESLRRQQLSAANPNPQLLQETMLWQWSQLS